MKIKKLTLSLSVAALGSYLIAGVIFFTSNFTYVQAKTFNVDQQKEASLSGIKLIDLSTISADIKIKNDDSDKIQLHYTGEIKTNSNMEEPKLIVEKDGSTLTIKIERKKKTKFGFFNGNYTSNLKLLVNLPNNYKGDFNLNSVSGDIKFQELNLEKFKLRTVSGDMVFAKVSANKIKINSTSGDVSCEYLKADDISIGTTSGDIELIEGDCKTFVFHTTSGNLEMEKLTSETAKVSSTSGDIEIKHGETNSFSGNSVSGDLKLQNVSSKGVSARTTSGDISFGNCSGDVNCSSVSGDVYGDISSFNKEVGISTTSGDISLKVKDGKFSFEARTRGEIIYKVGGKSISSDKKLILNCEDCDKEISLHSVSGDITVK